MKPVCLITGAAGRLGSSLCNYLANDFDIIAVYNNNVPKVKSQLISPINPALADGNGANNSIFLIKADLTKQEDLRRITEVSMAKFDRIDLIINSAADLKFHGKLLEISQAEDYPQSQLLINSIIPFKLVSFIHNSCWKNSKIENSIWNRNIINVSSLSGINVYDGVGQAFYSASKAALNILTLHLASELAPYSVRANAICPARFSNESYLEKVVLSIKKLANGNNTGEIITI